MCDTFAAVGDSTPGIWFGKNSDREPGEAQLVERIEGGRTGSVSVQCTYLAIPQAQNTYSVILSRPFWMWGAEMGANECGLVIGNEAVFTRLPYAKEGLLGMDLLRLALERAAGAREAVELITDLIGRHGQGGACGYRNRKFRYHNSFLIADPREAWVLETADRFWAAEKVRGLRTISNQLSIGREFDLISPEAKDFALWQGWTRSGEEFDFAAAFRDEKFSELSGARIRSSCTLHRLRSVMSGIGSLNVESCLSILRDHNGSTPEAGWKMTMPCAHSSWWPTRRAGQTTGSMVSHLGEDNQVHYLTGTSSPCLSVFKPVTFGAGDEDIRATELFWRHERLHRLVLGDYERRRAAFEEARSVFEAAALNDPASWERHLEILPEWIRKAEGVSCRPAPGRAFFDFYWKGQTRLDAEQLSNA